LVTVMGVDRPEEYLSTSNGIPLPKLPKEAARLTVDAVNKLADRATGEQVDDRSNDIEAKARYEYWRIQSEAANQHYATITALESETETLCHEQDVLNTDGLLKYLTIQRERSANRTSIRNSQRSKFLKAFEDRSATRENITNTISRIACALREQIDSERLVRAKGTHFPIFNQLLDNVEKRLGDAIVLSEGLQRLVDKYGERDTRDSNHLAEVLQCERCQNTSRALANFVIPPGQVNGCHHRAENLESIRDDLNSRRIRLAAIHGLSKNWQTIENEGNVARDEFSKEEQKRLNDLGKFLEDRTEPITPKRGACTATSEASHVAVAPATVSRLYECGSTCFGSPGCAATCIAANPAALATDIASVTPDCGECLSRVSLCLASACAVPCVMEIGCNECLGDSYSTCSMAVCL